MVTPSMQNFNMQRVKVYRLNRDGLWDDKGTGHVSMEYMEQSDSVGLVVISEEDTRTLLIHRISHDDIYQRQGDDTIITWADPEIGTEIALSFQEAQGCNYVWGRILEVQGHFISRDGPAPRRGPVDEFEIASNQLENDTGLPEGGTGNIELPAAELANLSDIVKAVTECNRFQRERISQQLLQPMYIRNLLEIFKTCEDLEDDEGLQQMHRLVKGLIMLNDTSLFEILLTEDNVMDVIGALEHDPELSGKQKHRAYLQERVIFKEVVPIKNAEVKAKIHQTYRIGYIKDVILPRFLDDATFATLSSLMLFNNVEVLMSLQADAEFMQELFDKLRQSKPHETDWQDLVAFLQELCSLAKHLQPAHRVQLFNKLLDLGMLEVMTDVMKSGDSNVRLRGGDVLLSLLQHDPSPLRNFLFKQSEHELFSVIISSFLDNDEHPSSGSDSSGGLQEQVLEMLKLLLDPESMEQSVEKNEFLDIFYDKYINQLIQTLMTGTPTAGAKVSGDVQVSAKLVKPATLGLVVELLCFCVQHHSFRIKYYILRNNVVEKVLRLLHCPQRWLVVAAVRFLRTCIGLKDEFYNRYLIRNNLLEPVITVFVENGPRYNLLNSAILELVEFVRRENIKGLITHIIEQFYQNNLDNIDYVDTFKQLKLKYDQSSERVTTSTAAGTNDATQNARELLIANRRRRDNDRGLDRDEEDYFNEDDNDNGMTDGPNENPGAAPMIGPSPPPVKVAVTTLTAGSTDAGDSRSGSGATKASTSDHGTRLSLVDYDDDDEDEQPTSSIENNAAQGVASSPSALPSSPAKRPGENGPSEILDAAKRARSSNAPPSEDGCLINAPPNSTPVVAGGGPAGLYWQHNPR